MLVTFNSDVRLLHTCIETKIPDISVFKEKERIELVAKGLIAMLHDGPTTHLVEHSERTSCFKIRTTDPGITSPASKKYISVTDKF